MTFEMSNELVNIFFVRFEKYMIFFVFLSFFLFRRKTNKFSFSSRKMLYLELYANIVVIIGIIFCYMK